MPRPSYLVIGHVTHDVLPDHTTLGGTASFAAAMALGLGYQVRVLTSAGDAFEAPGWVELAEPLPMEASQANERPTFACVPSRETTTFEYRWSGGKRTQRLTKTASNIAAAHVPAAWRHSDIWHIAPVANEIDAGLAAAIPEKSFLGVTPQGWLRQVNHDMVVHPTPWTSSEQILDRAQAVVLSREDIPNAYDLAAEWGRRDTVIVVTEAADGATIFARGKRMHVPALSVTPLHELGAGDIFAVAFFDRLVQGNAPEQAGLFASAAASLSVARRGHRAPPMQAEIRKAMQRLAAAR